MLEDEVGNVVTVIPQRRRVEGHQPQGINSQLLEIIQSLDQPPEVADAILAAVAKGLDVELVDDSVLVYSIVDSLMELDNVKMVQLCAENTGNRLNAIDLEKKFIGDYSYVTK